MSGQRAWFVGRKIVGVNFGLDSAGLSFEDESGVTIYNPCSLVEAFRPDRYISQRVVAEHWSREQFKLELGNADAIIVDLRDEGWVGPEAMVFLDGSSSMVVNAPPNDTVTFREGV